jgi:hypothetical protein
MKKSPYIPNHLLDIIFKYDGRIKYIPKKGIFVNIIHKYDERYKIIDRFLHKRQEQIEKSVRDGEEFYLDVKFENTQNMGLVFDFSWSYMNKFEICYYNFKNDKIQQIRSYIQ